MNRDRIYLKLKYMLEHQEHKSASTSQSQVSAGITHAVKHGHIKPNTINVDYGGGKYDKGKAHVEDNVSSAKLHVHDIYNRSDSHNKAVEKETLGKSDYVGMHNVLNVIKEPEHRNTALENMKKFMKPKTGVGHVTVYEGDRSGSGRMSKKDTGSGSSWQNHKPTASYVNEIKKVFPEHSHTVEHKGGNIHIKSK